MNYLDVRYTWGGNTADEGFDCSGFTRHVYQRAAGINLPRTTEAQANAQALVPVGRDELAPGDLVFFNTLGRTYSHVGVYVGDNKFVHAPRTGANVRVETLGGAYWGERLQGRGGRAKSVKPRLLAGGLRRPGFAQIRQPLACLVLERVAGDLQAQHTVQAEVAEVVSGFAPSGQRPMLTPEVQRQRAHKAFAQAVLFIGVNEVHQAVRADGAAQQLKALTQLLGDVELRDEGAAGFDPKLFVWRKHGGDWRWRPAQRPPAQANSRLRPCVRPRLGPRSPPSQTSAAELISHRAAGNPRPPRPRWACR